LNVFFIAVDKQAEPTRNITKVDTKVVPITSSQSSTPESPNTPTQVTLAKAPTPWLQNKNKPQEELPEWAKRTNVNKTDSDSSENAVSPIYVQVQQSSPQVKQKQEQKQYSIPQCQQTKPQQLSQPQQQQQQQQRQNINPVTSQRTNSQSHERVVPIRVS